MSEKRVVLYTRQNDKTLSQLKREKRIINHRQYVQLHFGDIAPLFMDSYDWFTNEAKKRVDKPEDVQASIWCSISKENCMRPIEGTVVYELEVPEKQVIYFDAVKWDYVLNRIYLPKNEADDKAYKERITALGVASRYDFLAGKNRNQFPDEEQYIRESWKRVFEIDNWSIYNVCGNIWEIKEEWVKRIIHPGEEI